MRAARSSFAKIPPVLTLGEPHSPSRLSAAHPAHPPISRTQEQDSLIVSSQEEETNMGREMTEGRMIKP
eukprot:80286-Amorphochlora_amoeboformis.AAC.1